MGRNSSHGEYRLGYGVVIKQPKNPSWPIMVDRLETFDYDQSLFATAARVTPKHDLDNAGVPEQITKSAKKTMQPVLISFGDTEEMSEEEKEIDHNEFENRTLGEHSDDIEHLMCAAIKKILGNDTKVCMAILTASSGYEYDEGRFLEPVLFLEGVKCTSGSLYEPMTMAERVEIPSIETPEEVAKDIALVLKALGLEADGNEPSWHIVVTNSCNPH